MSMDLLYKIAKSVGLFAAVMGAAQYVVGFLINATSYEIMGSMIISLAGCFVFTIAEPVKEVVK
jgi:hypothetical protein